MAESQFRDILDFFEEIGVFDVVLPFLLVFTVVFAILERTKVLGTEVIDGHEYTKKNLNSVFAFSTAFLVIASSRLVEIVTTVSSQIVVLLFLGVLFMLLVGTFWKQEDEPLYLSEPWNTIFVVIMFVGIGGIFLNELETEDGNTYLEEIEDFFGGDNDRLVGSILLLIIVVGFMFFIVNDGTGAKKGGGGDGH